MFKLEITSIEEFTIFVKIVKGADLDDEAIKKLTESLKVSNDKLVKAEEENKNG